MHQDIALDSSELDHAQLDRDRLRKGVLTCLKYPRGSEAQIRCLASAHQETLNDLAHLRECNVKLIAERDALEARLGMVDGEERKAPWQPISTFNGLDYEEVDIWIQIYESPRSMGFSDSFRIVEAYRKKGKWVHRQDGEEKELFSDYITHWMPIPIAPKP